MSSDYDDLRPPVSLTPVERQTFLLLHKVLAHLDTNEAEYHEKMVEVLTEGFTIEYEDVFTPYAELPKADCKLVFDILDMFRVMKASLEELPEPERDALLADHKYVLTFQGFDGNDAREGKMRSYVNFLQKTDRWTDLVDDVKAADGGNSHARLLGLYQAMLDVYQPIWTEKMKSFRGPRESLLDAAELRQVAGARG
jgi:uncharacterized protein YfbU (UPF0304 family)